MYSQSVCADKTSDKEKRKVLRNVGHHAMVWAKKSWLSNRKYVTVSIFLLLSKVGHFDLKDFST